MDNQIVLQDAFSFRELAEQCEALSENGPPKKLCEHLTVMAAAVTRHPLQSIQPSPWPSPPILLPPSPSHPSPLAAAITTSERESHYRSHPWWWSSQLETPATCSGCAWLAGYRGWGGGGGAVEVWYRGFVWWELHLRCELALPLQSGRWMTNEVCLFHSLSLSPFFVFILPPPLHTSPLCPGGERKGEFMWERLTATQSHFYSAPPPAYFTFSAARHAMHANT